MWVALFSEIPAEKKNTMLTDKFTKTAMNDAGLKRKESESLRCQDPTRMSNKDNMWKLRRDQGIQMLKHDVTFTLECLSIEV